eukprot:1147552-Prymnesium_polylepis.1
MRCRENPSGADERPATEVEPPGSLQGYEPWVLAGRWDPLSKMKCSGLVQSVEKVVESLGHHNPYNLSSRHKH